MIEPARATFLLIDMQNGFIDGASPLCIAGAAATVPTCARALEAARARRARLPRAPHLRRRRERRGGRTLESMGGRRATALPPTR
ncbi:MAG: hypothetical protein ACLSDQ_05985 [Adlercreutzia equolifaciens]